ncbi:MAG: hypothetical protein FWG81_08145 [Betaproteobacteria bacterium]|nr:hypothetical protein [Betaproteobacteria bacterium]
MFACLAVILFTCLLALSAQAADSSPNGAQPPCTSIVSLTLALKWLERGDFIVGVSRYDRETVRHRVVTVALERLIAADAASP